MIKKYSWIFLIAATLLMVYVMTSTGNSLKNPATPLGIINLELAYNAVDVQNILNAWDNDISKNSDVVADAKKNTWLDFIFLMLYSSLFYFLCKKLISFFKPGSFWKRIGNIIALATIATGLLDIVENIGMLKSLNGNVSDNIALLTASCSTVKWVLAFIIITFLITGYCYKIFVLKNKAPFSNGYN